MGLNCNFSLSEDFPLVPLEEVCSNLDLRDIASVSRVNKYLHYISNTNAVWRRIADQIGYPTTINDSMQHGDVRMLVIQFIFICKAKVSSMSEIIPDDIRRIATNKVPISIKNFQSLIAFRKARDKITVWKQSDAVTLNNGKNEIYKQIALLHTKSLKEVLEFADKLTGLCIRIAKSFPVTNGSLDISKRRITTLPEEIGHFTYLTVLKAYENQLLNLPQTIKQLTNLRHFYVGNNQLTHIPPEIGYLTNLITFDVSQNYLSGLPKEISQLTNLRHFDVSNNHLTSVSSEIGRMTNLAFLSFNGNQLTSLPNETSLLKNLNSLDLNSNGFTNLPPEVASLTRLHSLWIRQNKLTDLPAKISDLRALQLLDVTHNQITSLPPEIALLTTIEVLRFNENSLTALFPKIDRLVRLERLSVNNNRLTEVPSELASLKKLEFLDISNNQIQTLPKEISKKRRLQKLGCIVGGNPMVNELRSSKRQKKN